MSYMSIFCRFTDFLVNEIEEDGTVVWPDKAAVEKVQEYKKNGAPPSAGAPKPPPPAKKLIPELSDEAEEKIKEALGEEALREINQAIDILNA